MSAKPRILVIDDEEIIRSLSEKILSRHDFEVVTTDDGHSGVSVFKQGRDSNSPFDAVLLDLTLGEEMSGENTLARLKEIDPAVRVIVCSGYSSDAAVVNWRKHGFAGAVVKPFRADDLVSAVRKILTTPD